MEGHVEEIILHWASMPKKMSLSFPDPELHLKILLLWNRKNISFRLDMSFSARINENAPQSRTSKNGGTKLSDIITGTHS
ncbi:LOW QUALITY PROTEIN: uncharacterized protein LOC112324911 [Populus trichocarpa]|uniref:LOW QUALITY PROTEIN: uncharacterized protein LOC112324911 n=1 Tax=Populus trichocarpa TaxID=3694 RepID=UPI000D189740|nr:LOW QUALITY PROTEIN: uncharacterized protein LOC112324911 [Populus trichocarpa]|eukprot:XP_024445331.1 LOW QUALITY PROTEIN: uncharacterized protein LOC112324911 [Populus trichocarpa]